jgi:hypothetical protein
MARNIRLRIIRQSHISATPCFRYQASSARWELLQPSEQGFPVFDVEGCGGVE